MLAWTSAHDAILPSGLHWQILTLGTGGSQPFPRQWEGLPVSISRWCMSLCTGCSLGCEETCVGAPQSMMGEIAAQYTQAIGSHGREVQLGRSRGKAKRCSVSSWGCENILE